jgi:hypothetical protein
LIRRTIRNAIQSVRNPGQLNGKLVGHHRPMQDNRPPSAELLHGPRSRHYDYCQDCDELLKTCYGDRSAKKGKYMIREQFFLPAGRQR